MEQPSQEVSGGNVLFYSCL